MSCGTTKSKVGSNSQLTMRATPFLMSHCATNFAWEGS